MVDEFDIYVIKRKLNKAEKELAETKEENKVLMQECDRLIKEKGELLKKTTDVKPVKLILQIVQGRLNGANYTMLEAVKSNDTNAAYKMRGAIDICSEILADLRILTAKDGEQNG